MIINTCHKIPRIRTLSFFATVVTVAAVTAVAFASSFDVEPFEPSRLPYSADEGGGQAIPDEPDNCLQDPLDTDPFTIDFTPTALSLSDMTERASLENIKNAPPLAFDIIEDNIGTFNQYDPAIVEVIGPNGCGPVASALIFAEQGFVDPGRVASTSIEFGRRLGMTASSTGAGGLQVSIAVAGYLADLGLSRDATSSVKFFKLSTSIPPDLVASYGITSPITGDTISYLESVIRPSSTVGTAYDLIQKEIQSTSTRPDGESVNVSFRVHNGRNHAVTLKALNTPKNADGTHNIAFSDPSGGKYIGGTMAADGTFNLRGVDKDGNVVFLKWEMLRFTVVSALPKTPPGGSPVEFILPDKKLKKNKAEIRLPRK